MVRFELRLLAELGFGLDLSVCAASGVETDLVYVSPKSGRAVSRQAGEAWKDKLLVLPAFLREACAGDPSPQDIADGFELTGFFLARRVLEPRRVSIAAARASFIAALRRDARPPADGSEESGPGFGPPSGGLTTSDDANGAATTNAGSDSRASALDRLPG